VFQIYETATNFLADNKSLKIKFDQSLFPLVEIGAGYFDRSVMHQSLYTAPNDRIYFLSIKSSDIPSPVFLNREADLAQCLCPEKAVFYKNGRLSRSLKSAENSVKIDQDGFYQCFCPSTTLESSASEHYELDAPAPIPLEILEIRPSGFKVSWATSGSASGIVYLKSRDKGEQQLPFDDTEDLPIAVTGGDYEVKVELLEPLGDATTGPRWSQTVLVHIPEPDEVPPKVTDLQLRVNNGKPF
jgi:hypothetical protein